MTSRITFISILAVLLMAAVVRSQRGRGDRPRPFPRPIPGGRPPVQASIFFTGDRYEWETDLGAESMVGQKAFVSTEKNVTVVITRDPVLADNNMTGSVALYDSSGVVAIKLLGGRAGRGRGVRPPCFLASTALSFDDVVNVLSIRNGTNFSLPVDEVTLNGTSEPLSRQETRELFMSIKPLARFCRGGRLIQTTVVTSGASNDSDTETKSTVTLEGQVNVIVKAPILPVPGDGFPRPGNGFPRPGNGFPRPGNGFPRPGNGFPRPGNGFPRPGNGFPRPGSGFPRPGSGFPRRGSNIEFPRAA